MTFSHRLLDYSRRTNLIEFQSKYLIRCVIIYEFDVSMTTTTKADGNIVVRNIRESHLLLARIVAARGGSDLHMQLFRCFCFKNKF